MKEIQDLKSYGIYIEDELTTYLSEYLAKEIDKVILKKLLGRTRSEKIKDLLKSSE